MAPVSPPVFPPPVLPPPFFPPPFFIVGSSRSGTTLLRLLLCRHSRLHIPPETWYLTELVRRLPLDTALSDAQARAAIDIMLAEPRWPDLEMSAAELRAGVAALDRPRLADIACLPHRRLLARAGKQRPGDKTPPYIAIVPQLAAVFPGARFIHLIRDGRDVAMSFVAASFRGRPRHGARFEWTAAIRHGRAWRASPLAASLLDVRYEDLVAAPEAALLRICDFLGETFEPAMLAPAAGDLALLPARERVIHTKLGQPISPAQAQAWRRLPAPACFAMEASLHRDLRALGYGLRFAGPLWRPALALAGWLLHAAAPLLDRAVPALLRRGLWPRGWYL